MDNKPTVQEVDTDDILVDDRYQRAVLKSFIKGTNFDWRRYETITLSKRRENELYCIDGQQRLNLAKKAGIKRLPAFIHSGLSFDEEARIFGEQGTHPISALDRHKAGLLYDKITQDIDREVLAEGFRVGGEKVSYTIRSAGTLRTIHEKYGAGIIKRVLSVLRQSYGGDRQVVESYVLKSLAQVLSEIPAEKDAQMLYKLSFCPLNKIKLWAREVSVMHPGMNSSLAYIAAFKRAFNYKNRNRV